MKTEYHILAFCVTLAALGCRSETREQPGIHVDVPVALRPIWDVEHSCPALTVSVPDREIITLSPQTNQPLVTVISRNGHPFCMAPLEHLGSQNYVDWWPQYTNGPINCAITIQLVQSQNTDLKPWPACGLQPDDTVLWERTYDVHITESDIMKMKDSEQNIRQVSSESAPSASPDEPSM
jgi:hypothetical protein